MDRSDNTVTGVYIWIRDRKREGGRNGEKRSRKERDIHITIHTNR